LNLLAIDLEILLDLEIGVRLKGPGCANRGHPGGEIEPREAERHVIRADPISAKEVERAKEMVVHTDEARKCCVSVEVDGLRIRWNYDGSRIPHVGDPVVANDDRLVAPGRGTSSIDHSHVRERNAWLGNSDECAIGGSGRSLRRDREWEPREATSNIDVLIAGLETECGRCRSSTEAGGSALSWVTMPAYAKLDRSEFND